MCRPNAALDVHEVNIFYILQFDRLREFLAAVVFEDPYEGDSVTLRAHTKLEQSEYLSEKNGTIAAIKEDVVEAFAIPAPVVRDVDNVAHLRSVHQRDVGDP